MGHANDIHVHLVNSSSKPVVIRDANLDWGKFYRGGDDYTEIYPSNVNGRVVEPGATRIVYACGASGALAGTEGGFNVVDNISSNQITKIYWDVPWRGRNTFSTTNGIRWDGGTPNAEGMGDVYVRFY
ncbi:hypothetical protein K443DRAFT_686837 [Laccaria amethystina LaAM-08-1]|uniref:Uncharacterized protein n=1 Tax=Laccaria amethystina LaAM-08-1 TaxID=1095629 RepID=A0A0C9X0B6_9AGAR|nr:hypothetical protein K443DRAFT_687022 [Laccaria amethystina LaAM-08-1]KIJ90331.1 hypothetical protein K443DRAFT_686837 [Laccaria amethystina LaAM-08-1]